MNELVVPDPRQAPVPSGWAEAALPVIMASQSWDQLDEYEARLRAVASYVASFDGDALEFEKALRIVECQRGLLLGPDPHQGRPGPRVTQVEESDATQQRWRRIAREWDAVWPSIRDATRRREVTQAAVLRLIAGDGVVTVPLGATVVLHGGGGGGQAGVVSRAGGGGGGGPVPALVEALSKIAEQQPKVLAYIEANGFVFDDIGKEPGNWKHLAFSIYSDLCEVDTWARAALEEWDGS